MASQASLHSPWREPRKLNLLFALTGVCFSLFFYFHGPKMVLDLAASSRHTSGAGEHVLRHNEIYTGSFIVVPRGGYKCWRSSFDNRTGRTWGGRYLDCNAVTETNENQGHQAPSSQRMQAISAAFQR